MKDKRNLWSPDVCKITPYIPGEQTSNDDFIKLNTNESPLPPSPYVFEAINKAADDALRLYPDPESQELRDVIADYFSVESSNVFLGNGSDEVLAHAFNAFFKKKPPILFPDLTYSFYPVFCQLYGILFNELPLDKNFKISIDDYNQSNGGIIFPNPNAPTGVGLSRHEIIKLLELNSSSVVIIDEAYIDYANNSREGADEKKVSTVVDLTHKYKNLLVIQTMSKSRGLAGLRIGYAIGDKFLIEALMRVKNSFNSYPLDRIAQKAAEASFCDDDYFKKTCDYVIHEREELIRQLTSRSFVSLPSSSNFLLVRHALFSGDELTKLLRKENILVRFFSKERLNQFIRITIGTAEQNKILLQALDQILLSKK